MLKGHVSIRAMVASLVAVLALLSGTAVRAQAPSILPEALPNGSSPATMLRDSLDRQAFELLEARHQRYEARTDLDEVARYQRTLKREFVERIGGLPGHVPLNPRITGTVEREGYTVEKILLETQPHFFATAGLFLPDPKRFPPPWPAVLIVCGHSAEGKQQEGYQGGAALAALNGLAALVLDPVGQGERLQILPAAGKPPAANPTVEHTLLGTAAIPLGWNTARWMIGDGMAAIDYLRSRDDIRSDRIGCMGNSGGGTQTSYLMALDDRIYAAAPSCYLTGFARLLETIGPQDAEQNIFGQIELGLDHGDYVLLRAPRPTLIACATNDYFDITGAWNLFRDAKRLYHRYGEGRNVELVEVDAPHGWHPFQRRASVQFMMQHLDGRLGAVLDPEVVPLTLEEMSVTPEGQVLKLPGAVSAFDQVREESDRLAAERKAANLPPEELRRAVRQVAGIRELSDIEALVVMKHEPIQIDAMSCQPLTFQFGEDIFLPAILAGPDAAGAKEEGGSLRKITLLMLAEGKSAALGNGGEIERRVAAGETVLAVDLRGIGETAPTGKKWYHQRFGANGGNAAVAYLLGKTLVGLQAEDCLAVARWLASEEGVEGVSWVASGELAVAALHAAALEPRLVESLETRQGLTSWSDVVATPLTENQFTSLVHGALRTYDLPDLANLLGGKLKIVDPQDAQGKPVNP